MQELAKRICELLDPYEVADTDTTTEKILNDLINDPIAVIAYFVDILEDLNERGQI